MCEGYCSAGPPACSGCGPVDVDAQLVGLLELVDVPAQRAPVDELLVDELLELEPAHVDHVAAGYLGCPGCVAAGVLLCPDCLEPTVDGRHWRCIGLGRWLVFGAYVAAALAAVFFVFALAVAFPTAALTGGAAGLFAALGWPYRCYLYRLAAVLTR